MLMVLSIFFCEYTTSMETFEDTPGNLIYEPYGYKATSNNTNNTNNTNPLDIDNNIYNICANVTYKSGNPDVRSALYDCVENMADAQSPPR